MAKSNFELNTHIDLPSDVARELYTLALLNNTTVAELAEKGIALIAVALKAAKQGYRLAVVNEDDEVIADIEGIDAKPALQSYDVPKERDAVTQVALEHFAQAPAESSTFYEGLTIDASDGSIRGTIHITRNGDQWGYIDADGEFHTIDTQELLGPDSLDTSAKERTRRS